MNQIVSGLFIGNYRDSKDLSQIKANSITHILSIHDSAKCGTIQDIKYFCIKAADSFDQNVIQFFPKCNDFIHKARSDGGNVLVHCLAGISRSVTIVVAYLMSITKFTHKQIIEAIRFVRKESEPNLGFVKQLRDFESFGVKQERDRLASQFSFQSFPNEQIEIELRKLLN
ncbi:Dual specificity protein phosphatase 22 [Blomia tropicalis]|nr:Dual specificity protein phosphatase 22 [Blomia tropicalis]